MKNYVSNIIHKYGDSDNVPKDCKALYDIINRQGTSLLIDCIAEHIGGVCNKMNLSAFERSRLSESLVTELTESLKERT